MIYEQVLASLRNEEAELRDRLSAVLAAIAAFEALVRTGPTPTEDTELYPPGTPPKTYTARAYPDTLLPWVIHWGGKRCAPRFSSRVAAEERLEMYLRKECDPEF